MKLYTSSNAIIKAINISSLKDIQDTPNKWKVTSLTINNIPIVAYHAPRQVVSQYRFLWDSVWYRISATDVLKLPELEQMKFSTNPGEIWKPKVILPFDAAAKTQKELDYVKGISVKGAFITLTQAPPNIKGLFVGTVLRALGHQDAEDKLHCIFRDKEITLESDFYRLAEPSEIMSYFWMHSNGEIWVQSSPHSNGFLAIIKNVEGTKVSYKTHIGMKAVAKSELKEVGLNYVFLPTKEQLLNHKVAQAKREGFAIGTTVQAPMLGEVVIQSFSVDASNRLIVAVGKRGNANIEKMVPIESLGIPTHELKWDVSDGVKLATQVIKSIPDMDSSFLSAKVKEDFLITLKGWCENKLKSL